MRKRIWIIALAAVVALGAVAFQGLHREEKPRQGGSGAALGLSRLELLWSVVLPQARGTLLASAVLGFGRAVGDTMLPLMLAGNATIVPDSVLSSIRTLTAHMAMVTANEVGGAAYQSLFMAGLFLLVINAAVSLCVRRFGRRGEPA